MLPIRRKINFQIKNSILYIRIKWAQFELYVSSGFVVDSIHWNHDHCDYNTFHGPGRIPASTINRHVLNLLDDINAAFSHFEAQDVIPDKQQLRSLLKGEMPDVSMSIEAAWNSFIREGNSLKQWSENTSRSIAQVRNLFLKFFPKLTFRDLNLDTLQSFIILQQSQKLSEADFAHGQKGYANNVISKNCNVLKRFLKWCVKQRLISSDIVNNWRVDIKSVPKPILFLTWPELMRVYDLDLSDNRMLDVVRDIFCLMCFTSLRISDALSLMKSQISPEGIRLTTQKTSANLVIDLNDYSRSIIEKYLNEGAERELLFPKHTCAAVNFHLKTIGMMAGLHDPVAITQYYGSERITTTRPKWELLSSHWGRRTFVCNALALGIPTHVVMKWTGHRNLSSMKPYIDVADGIRRSEMEKFNSKK